MVLTGGRGREAAALVVLDRPFEVVASSHTVEQIAPRVVQQQRPSDLQQLTRGDRALGAKGAGTVLEHVDADEVVGDVGVEPLALSGIVVDSGLLGATARAGTDVTARPRLLAGRLAQLLQLLQHVAARAGSLVAVLERGAIS